MLVCNKILTILGHGLMCRVIYVPRMYHTVTISNGVIQPPILDIQPNCHGRVSQYEHFGVTTDHKVSQISHTNNDWREEQKLGPVANNSNYSYRPRPTVFLSTKHKWSNPPGWTDPTVFKILNTVGQSIPYGWYAVHYKDSGCSAYHQQNALVSCQGNSSGSSKPSVHHREGQKLQLYGNTMFHVLLRCTVWRFGNTLLVFHLHYIQILDFSLKQLWEDNLHKNCHSLRR